MTTDEDITGSNSDAEYITYKERYRKWIVENENIFKEGRKEPVADNSFDNGDKKVYTQTPESEAISAAPGNLLKQPEGKNGENNIKDQDIYTPKEKVTPPVQQTSFSRGWNPSEHPVYPTKQKIPERTLEGVDIKQENIKYQT